RLATPLPGAGVAPGRARAARSVMQACRPAWRSGPCRDGAPPGQDGSRIRHDRCMRPARHARGAWPTTRPPSPAAGRVSEPEGAREPAGVWLPGSRRRVRNDTAMRIAILSTPFIPTPPPQYGGTELVIAELVEGLVERGHDVTLFATGDSRSSAELRWLFPTAHWPPDALTDVDHVSWALRHVAAGEYDLVHATSAVALPFTRWLRRLPVVYTIHHEREDQLSAIYRRFPDVYYVAISKDQRSREVPLRRCTVIHHGLDPRKYQWTSRPADYLAFVARFAPYKGPHTAIDVAERVGLPIRIAGEVHEPDRAFAERELRPRLSRAHVTHLGPIGLAVKAPLLRAARALLAPLTWNEPFGL